MDATHQEDALPTDALPAATPSGTEPETMTNGQVDEPLRDAGEDFTDEDGLSLTSSEDLSAKGGAADLEEDEVTEEDENEESEEAESEESTEDGILIASGAVQSKKRRASTTNPIEPRITRARLSTDPRTPGKHSSFVIKRLARETDKTTDREHAPQTSLPTPESDAKKQSAPTAQSNAAQVVISKISIAKAVGEFHKAKGNEKQAKAALAGADAADARTKQEDEHLARREEELQRDTDRNEERKVHNARERKTKEERLRERIDESASVYESVKQAAEAKLKTDKAKAHSEYQAKLKTSEREWKDTLGALAYRVD